MHKLVTTVSIWSADRCLSSLYLFTVFCLLQFMASRSLELSGAACNSLTTLYAVFGMVLLAECSCLTGMLLVSLRLLEWYRQVCDGGNEY